MRQTDLPLRRKHGELVDDGTEYPTGPLAGESKTFFCRESFVSWTEWTAGQEWWGLNPITRRDKIAAALGALRRDNHRFAGDPVFANFGHLEAREIDYFSNI